MTYAQPTIQAASASKAIQSGQQKPSSLATDFGGVKIETPQAYEADE